MQTNEKLSVYIFLALNFLQWVSIVEVEYGLPQIIKYGFSLFALSGLVYYRIHYPVKRTDVNSFDPLVLFFMVWSVFLIFQALGNFTDLFFIQRIFGQRYFFLPYLLPLILFYTRYEPGFFGNILRMGPPLLLVSVGLQLYVLLFNMGTEMYEPLHRVLLFDTGSAFFLLTAHLASRKYVSYLTLGYFMLAIVLYAHFGRRGLFLEAFLLMLGMLILRLRSPLSQVHDRMVLYFGLLMMGLGVMLLFEPVLSSLFIFQRGFDQDAFDSSRGQVFADFFLDFRGWDDWIVGRGLDGHILRTIALDETEQLIENGFLTVLLKGGLLYLIPMILLMLRACFLGFFRSRNDLSKALSIIVLVQLVSMVLFGLPDYATQYVWVWIAIAASHSKALRQLDNDALIEAM